MKQIAINNIAHSYFFDIGLVVDKVDASENYKVSIDNKFDIVVEKIRPLLKILFKVSFL